MDAETGSLWSAEGLSVLGEIEGSRLRPVDHFDVMWFAWASFHPDTHLFSEADIPG
jgi:hypothetical protein